MDGWNAEILAPWDCQLFISYFSASLQEAGKPWGFFFETSRALTIEGVAGGGGAKILWAYFSPNQACFLQPPVVEDVSSPIFSIHFTEGSSHDISISDLLAC